MRIELPADYSALSFSERRDVRREYVKTQSGFCHHCKSSLESPPPDGILSKKIDWKCFPENFLKHPIHLHHNHKTDKTIGAVHAYCNAVLWQYHGE